jgi:hypothetical protein
MRLVVRDLLNPYLTKFANIEGEISKLKSYVDQSQHKMDSLEELFHSKNKKSKYDELIDKFH